MDRARILVQRRKDGVPATLEETEHNQYKNITETIVILDPKKYFTFNPPPPSSPSWGFYDGK